MINKVFHLIEDFLELKAIIVFYREK